MVLISVSTTSNVFSILLYNQRQSFELRPFTSFGTILTRCGRLSVGSRYVAASAPLHWPDIRKLGRL